MLREINLAAHFSYWWHEFSWNVLLQSQQQKILILVFVSILSYKNCYHKAALCLGNRIFLEYLRFNSSIVADSQLRLQKIQQFV